MPKRILRMAGIVAVAWSLLILLVFLFQEHLLFHPQELPQERVQTLQEEEKSVIEVSVTTPEEDTLHGWIVHPTEKGTVKENVVFYFGGNAEEVSQMVGEAKQFPEWSFVLMNYRGYGLSEGEPGEEAFYQDALQLYDTFTQQAAHISRVAVMGRSIGTGVAVHLAQHRPVDGVILVSPYDRITNVAQDLAPLFPMELILRHSFPAVEKAPEIQAPLYALIALDDGIVPPERSRELVEAWGGPKEVREVSGKDHGTLIEGPTYEAFLTQSLEDLQNDPEPPSR